MAKLRIDRASMAVALLLCALTACGRGGLGSTGTSIDGRDAERAIDTRLTPLLKNANPQMTVAKAVCPGRLDLSPGKTGRCTLTVDGVGVPVKVVGATDGRHGFSVSLDGNVYVGARLDQFVDALLVKTYGAKAAAHCEPPSIRTVAPGASFSCRVSGSAHLASVELRALPSGEVAVVSPSDLELAAGGWINDAVRKHKAKASVVISGTDVAAKIDDTMGAQMAANGESAHLGRARCPSQVDLTGSARAVCAVAFHGQDLHVAVWIDDDIAGFRTELRDVAINRSLVGRYAENELNGRIATKGLAAKVDVACAPGYVVVKPGDSFYCPMTVTGGKGRLQVTVEDTEGHVKWRAVDLGGSGPAVTGGGLSGLNTEAPVFPNGVRPHGRLRPLLRGGTLVQQT